MTSKQKIYIGIIVLIVVLIWINSSVPTQMSRAQSGVVQDFFNRMLSLVGGTKTLSMHIVRKAGHVIEYAVLGFLCALFIMVPYKKIKAIHIWFTITFVLTVSVIDESIQILSGRGPLVSDILLDMCSAIAAILLVFFGNWFIKRIKKEDCKANTEADENRELQARNHKDLKR